ncbi:hypothetical protein B0H19DRAFT_1380001, partial [Mycena capillaripes]
NLLTLRSYYNVRARRRISKHRGRDAASRTRTTGGWRTRRPSPSPISSILTWVSPPTAPAPAQDASWFRLGREREGDGEKTKDRVVLECLRLRAGLATWTLAAVHRNLKTRVQCRVDRPRRLLPCGVETTRRKSVRGAKPTVPGSPSATCSSVSGCVCTSGYALCAFIC